MSAAPVAWFLVGFIGIGSLAAVCWIKGRRLAAVAVVLGAILPPGAFFVALITPDPQQDLNFTPHVLVGLVGCGLFFYGVGSAVRLAKPQSRWARQFYNEERMERARSRFGDQRTRSLK